MLKIERVLVSSLKHHPRNVRLHGKRNLEAIKKSLTDFGQQTPIIVDKLNQVIVGNGRLSAMIEMKWEYCDIIRSGLEGAKAEAFAIADNKTTDLSEFDKEKLSIVLKELESQVDLHSTGFSTGEMESLFLMTDTNKTEKIPAPLPPPKTRKGDMYILGKHRLLCGDASDETAVARLLSGKKIDLIYTDPPWNAKAAARSANAYAVGTDAAIKSMKGFDELRYRGKPTDQMRPRDRVIDGDYVDEEQYQETVKKWFTIFRDNLKGGGPFYIWGGRINMVLYPTILREVDLHMSQFIVWVKSTPVLGRQDFMLKTEICFHGWKQEKGSGFHYFNPACKGESDVWEFKSVASGDSRLHIAEKPVDMAIKALTCSSKPGDSVADFFSGSGSTLMACEKMNRVGYFMELDELFCDVIIKRWEDATKKKAILVPMKGAKTPVVEAISL